MAIELSDKIVAANAQPFPVFEDIDGLGGFHVVPDVTARDAISSQKRKEGMLVSVTATLDIYKLSGGITNGDWNLFAGPGGAGLSDIVDDTTPQLGAALDVNGFSIKSLIGTNVVIANDDSGDLVSINGVHILGDASNTILLPNTNDSLKIQGSSSLNSGRLEFFGETHATNKGEAHIRSYKTAGINEPNGAIKFYSDTNEFLRIFRHDLANVMRFVGGSGRSTVVKTDNDNSFLGFGIGSGADDITLSRTDGPVIALQGTGQSTQKGHLTIAAGTTAGVASTDGVISFITTDLTRMTVEKAGNVRVISSVKLPHFIGAIEFDTGVASQAIPVIRTNGSSIQLQGGNISMNGGNVNLGGGAVNPFTGSHVYKMKSGENIAMGDAILLDGYEIIQSNAANSTTCAGVLSKLVDENSDGYYFDSFKNQYDSYEDLYCVSAVGDIVANNVVGFKVCDENGAIYSGDLLVTSSIPGRLMKQSYTYSVTGFDGYGDPIYAEEQKITNKTVGKCMEDIVVDGYGNYDGAYGYIYCG